MLVGGAVTQTSNYIANFRNRFVKSINTDQDGLYSAKSMGNYND